MSVTETDAQTMIDFTRIRLISLEKLYTLHNALAADHPQRSVIRTEIQRRGMLLARLPFPAEPTDTQCLDQK